ncbi:MAG: carbohydrate ABC transporter permease [Eubacteriales bacterium]|nr:carbohydrate ABC transporter permease [Eubacteriales bacterium]
MKANVSAIRETRADRMFRLVVYALLAVLLIAYVYPLYFVVIASISDPNAVYNGEVLFLPAQMTLEGYEEIFHYGELWIGYLNSIFYTVAGVFINISVTMMAAYALSRKEMMLRGVILKLFMFTMFFGGGLIPTYLLVKSLGLLDSRWVLLLNGAVSVYNLIITRTFLVSTLPEELHEAATMDGCRETRYLISVVLPLSGAIIGVNALYYGAGHWNSYFSAMIYLTNRSKFPLQLILREILNATTSSNVFEAAGSEAEKARQMRVAEVIKYCSIIVSSIPLLVAYPFVQKSFVKGVMIGSIKG